MRFFQLGAGDEHPTTADPPAPELYDYTADEPDEPVDEVGPVPEIEPEPRPAVPVADAEALTAAVVPPGAQMAIDLGPGFRPGSWKLPPAAILKRGNGRQVDRRLVEEGGRVLEATMREFGVDARLVGMTVGPTVTRYELELAPGVKVNRVTGLSHDIAYAMASPDVRILAPIPGRSAIGVEVPNRQRQLVTLGDVLSTPEAKQANHPLEVGLGRDIAGRAVMLNLADDAPPPDRGRDRRREVELHQLGRDVDPDARTRPTQVRLILVDPKRVELGAYNEAAAPPHPGRDESEEGGQRARLGGARDGPALRTARRGRRARHHRLQRRVRPGRASHQRTSPTRSTGGATSGLPFIVVVVDELNDLMMVAARDVEASICRIAQMARAVGIHLVIATQRPSVDVITGVIKANIPSRLAFSVSSLADSRVILDQAGAEKLIGQGDMLLQSGVVEPPPAHPGCRGSTRSVCARSSPTGAGSARSPSTSTESRATSPPAAGAGADVGDDDELLTEAMELVVRSGLGSTSMLQRKLRVGFARAGRLMDLLERKGVVGPSEGSKARAVLMTVEELEEMHDRV